jgi:hypothetical protein
MHPLVRNKSQGMIFKIDFEKSYDRVRWISWRRFCREKDFLSSGPTGLCRLLKGDKCASM